MFDAFNEHWTTLPILVFRGLYAVFGISTYWPYLILLVVVHLAIVVLLWHVMVRSAINPWLALGFTALVAITGVGPREPHQRVAGAVDRRRSHWASGRCSCCPNVVRSAGATRGSRCC